MTAKGVSKIIKSTPFIKIKTCGCDQKWFQIGKNKLKKFSTGIIKACSTDALKKKKSKGIVCLVYVLRNIVQRIRSQSTVFTKILVKYGIKINKNKKV